MKHPPQFKNWECLVPHFIKRFTGLPLDPVFMAFEWFCYPRQHSAMSPSALSLSLSPALFLLPYAAAQEQNEHNGRRVLPVMDASEPPDNRVAEVCGNGGRPPPVVGPELWHDGARVHGCNVGPLACPTVSLSHGSRKDFDN